MNLRQIKKWIAKISPDNYVSEEDANFLKSITFEQFNQLSPESKDKIRTLRWRYKVIPNKVPFTWYLRMLLKDCPKDALIIDLATGKEI
mgnify:CR=1 FL=1